MDGGSTEFGSEYAYRSGGATHAHAYLVKPVLDMLARHAPPGTRAAFDLGCGNGSFARALLDANWDVTGVDPSRSGIEMARLHAPSARFEVASAYDDLADRFGTYPVVTCLEVIEHLYDPRSALQTLNTLLRPGGVAVISTPYHGYLKNVVLAVTGKLDDHFTALWDHGHIKFFSIRTLSRLMEQVGLMAIEWKRVGRIPALAKSMIVAVKRSADS